jgi:sulfatase modifying factor 1
VRAIVERILGEAGPEGRADEAQVAADWCEEQGLAELEASMLDRAHGLAPHDERLARRRAAALDRLARGEHGLVWRYVPEGTFLMGSPDGDPDERPVHPVRLPGFHVMDVPISWVRYAALMEWPAPPELPKTSPRTPSGKPVWPAVRVVLSYSAAGEGEDRDWDIKPMVGVSAYHAEALAERISHDAVRYGLPTEAQWEKAARGGLIGARYPWGDEPPTPQRCDSDHFGYLEIAPSRSLPPNGYGLYAMCGGVSEWTATLYDALAYQDPPHPPPEGDREQVLRGGSFVDCAAAVTVSFRASLAARRYWTPTVGFRLVRVGLDQGASGG